MDSADYKQAISRSYSEKLNMGNYESKDFFASRNIELPQDKTPEELSAYSDDLFKECYMDVQRSILEFKLAQGIIQGFDWKKVKGLVDRLFNKKATPITIEEFESLSPEEKDFMNSCKKLLKRTEKV